MADAVLFMGWNRPVAGREAQANALFKESLGQLATWQKEGRIESFEPVVLSAHGGDLNGFVLVRGDARKLAELRLDERYIDMMIKGNMLLIGWGSIPGFVGQGLERMMARYEALTAR